MFPNLVLYMVEQQQQQCVSFSNFTKFYNIKPSFSCFTLCSIMQIMP